MGYFKVTGQVPNIDKDRAYLLKSTWNDYGYVTSFTLYVFDEYGVRHEIGSLKIGQFDMKPALKPELPQQFDSLSSDFFSLGQEASYYAAIRRDLDPDTGDKILEALRDVAYDLPLFEKASEEDVTQSSLLRDVSPLSVKNQFSRIIAGQVELTPFNFTYNAESISGGKIKLDFNVVPKSNPPTNLHVLIGRNGVGKTTLLSRMAKDIVSGNKKFSKPGSFSEESSLVIFSRLIMVSFSAFDPFFLPEDKDSKDIKKMKYSYIGLKNNANNKNRDIKSAEDLANKFVESIAFLFGPSKKGIRWSKALETLSSDPGFKEIYTYITSLNDSPKNMTIDLQNYFDELSSGHKIVLLTISSLISEVEEKTIVLFDEPEAHLHPPLLSAFIRALSDLLIDRNGVAILATHSPVVLQEVPKKCVTIINRIGDKILVTRPSIETFGESVGLLTREVFDLEVTHSGFHKIISNATDSFDTYDEVIKHFGNELSDTARAVVRSQINRKIREQKGDS